MEFIDYFIRNSSLKRQIQEEEDHRVRISLMDCMRKTRLTINLSFIFSFIVFLTALINIIVKFPLFDSKILILLSISLYLFSLPFIYKLIDNDKVLKLLLLAGGSTGVFIRSLSTSGVESSPFYWICLIPLTSALIFEKRVIIWSLILSIVMVVVIFNGDELGIFFGPSNSKLQDLLGFLGLLLASTLSAIAFDRQATHFQELLIKQEKEVQDTKKLASLGNMAAGVAHEINNPLMIISGNLLILERVIDQLNIGQEERYKVIRHLEKASNNISRIKNIIHSLLAYSRMKSKDNFKKFTITEFITNLEKVIAESEEINCIQWPLLANSKFLLTADFTLLTQVMTNLIFNAWHATRNLAHNEIKLEVIILKNEVYIKVIDQGVIESAEIIENMFNPFYTTKPIGEGTGLGLSLSKGIIEMHGGDLYYDHESPTTAFIVKLPLYR